MGDLEDAVKVLGEAVKVIEASVDKINALENRVVRMLKELKAAVDEVSGKATGIEGNMDDLRESILNLTNEQAIQERIDRAAQTIIEQTEKLKEGGKIT